MPFDIDAFPPPLTAFDIDIGAPSGVAMFGTQPARGQRPKRNARHDPFLFRSPTVIAAAAVPAGVATFGTQPARGQRPKRNARRDPFLFRPDRLPLAIPPYGPAIASTIMLDVEAGGSVTFEFATNIIPDRGGLEYRRSVRARPRSSWKFPVLLSDVQSRDMRSRMLRGAAAGDAYGLALPYEAAFLLDDASGATIYLDTTMCDWAIISQRVIVVGHDNTAVEATVQSVTPSSILLDVVPGLLGRGGCRVMPVVPVYLIEMQPLGRYARNLERWQIVAEPAGRPGFVNTTTVVGATINTTPDLNPLFDRGIVMNDTNASSMIPEADEIDLGSLIVVRSTRTISDEGRSIVYRSSRRVEWQWFKKFINAVRGRQKRFRLSTGRPDLKILSVDGGGASITVAAPSTGAGGVGEADYVGQWFNSQAHTLLCFNMVNGTQQWINVSTAADSAPGVQQIDLAVPLVGALAEVDFVSFAELVRFDSDEITVTWNRTVFAVEVPARTIQQ